MDTPKPTTPEEYIATVAPEAREHLENLRHLVRSAIPDAEEVLSYGIPCLKRNDTYVIYYAGFKKHVSLYPAPRGVQGFEELEQYKGGKGTVQFPLNNPLPEELIRRIAAQKDLEARKREKPPKGKAG